jgi:NAD(P)-dependent dehydrogenase (short-subunit alcohol dehydrogenase family)
MAQRFAQAGWFVALADVDVPGMAQTGALLPAGRWSAHRLDVRDAAAGTPRWRCGAGGWRCDRWWPTTPGCRWAEAGRLQRGRDRAGDAVNLTGATLGRGRLSLAQGGGAAGGGPVCLLNTASAAALYGTPGTSAYAATKAGLRALTEALDAEWAADGIAVRSLMPGFIAAADRAGALRQRRARSAMWSQRQRLDIGRPDDVAQAAWQAVHGARLHTLVGPTARRLACRALAAGRWCAAGCGGGEWR